jgi:fucose 4-O-acetylase-like acetyltransferase
MANEEKKRDTAVDILRVLGLFLVILAHSNIPGSLFNFREFDVPLLLFVSGISFFYSYKQEKWLSYVWKRVKRLIFPVWLFLGIFFLFFHFCFHVSYDLSMILNSFALTGSGIMFIWVFRIFFTTACINPFLKKGVDRLGTRKSFFLFYFLLCVIDYCWTLASSSWSGISVKLFEYVVSYSVGFGLLSGMGILCAQMKDQDRIYSGLLSACIWLFLRYLTGGAELQAYKYPPMLYYESYGLMWCFFLYVLFSKTNQQESNHFLTWLSKNTLNIYLAHILLYYTMNYSGLQGKLPAWALFCFYGFVSSLLVYLFESVKRCMKNGLR